MDLCWRCCGRGHLGQLPTGAYLICRICRGSGMLHQESLLRLAARWVGRLFRSRPNE